MRWGLPLLTVLLAFDGASSAFAANEDKRLPRNESTGRPIAPPLARRHHPSAPGPPRAGGAPRRPGAAAAVPPHAVLRHPRAAGGLARRGHPVASPSRRPARSRKGFSE